MSDQHFRAQPLLHAIRVLSVVGLSLGGTEIGAAAAVVPSLAAVGTPGVAAGAPQAAQRPPTDSTDRPQLGQTIKASRVDWPHSSANASASVAETAAAFGRPRRRPRARVRCAATKKRTPPG